jgi:four helix bundle protein
LLYIILLLTNNILGKTSFISLIYFRNFLFIAKGLCGEVRSMSYLGYRLGYFKEDCFKNIHNLSTEISKMISGLIKTL